MFLCSIITKKIFKKLLSHFATVPATRTLLVAKERLNGLPSSMALLRKIGHVKNCCKRPIWECRSEIKAFIITAVPSRNASASWKPMSSMAELLPTWFAWKAIKQLLLCMNNCKPQLSHLKPISSLFKTYDQTTPRMIVIVIVVYSYSCTCICMMNFLKSWLQGSKNLNIFHSQHWKVYKAFSTTA